MKAIVPKALLIVACFGAAATAGVAQTRLYRWVDDQGVVHYGDRIPPEYASRDRAILNDQGVPVGFVEGEKTDAELAALREARNAEQAKRAARAEVARRDRMLLQTYLSVEDIIDLRDRRLELLESQIKVTELYLANLRERLGTLKTEAARYKPISDRENARELPDDLAKEIDTTEASIAVYEDRLAQTRADQSTLRASFDSDIARFRELKGG